MRDFGVPEVSVVICTIRFDALLDDAVESVLVQSEIDLELILVLDGVRLVRREWMSDPRVNLVILDARRGTPVALNAGILAAGAPLIARLDADDLMLPGRLRAQKDLLDSRPEIDCVATPVRVIDHEGRRLGSLSMPDSPARIRRTLLLRNCIVHSSVMYRRARIVYVGGYSVRNLRSQDYELFLRMSWCDMWIASIPGEFTAYRVHSNQASRNTSPWAGYTREVLRARLLLAESYGPLEHFIQLFRNLAWFGMQVLRHYGLRMPRYLKGSDHVA